MIKNRLGCQNSLNINIENLQSNINKQIDCTNQDFSKIETNVTEELPLISIYGIQILQIIY